MQYPSSEDRQAVDLAVDEANARAFGPWALLASSIALALMLNLFDLDGGSGYLIWAPFGLILLSSSALALLGWVSPEAARGRTGLLSILLVAIACASLSWLLVRVPDSLAVVAAAFTLTAVGAGLVFTWRLPQAVGAQLLVHLGWFSGLLLSPGPIDRPGHVAAWSALLLGGTTVALLTQRSRWEETRERTLHQRERERFAAISDRMNAELFQLGKERDRLFSDVTNGLREPVVRLLRAIEEGAGGAGRVDRLQDPTWIQGVRLLHKLDDVGTLALHHRGHIRLRAQRVDLRRELIRLTELSRPWVEAAGIGIELSLGEVEPEVHLDRNRLERILVAMLAEVLRRCPVDTEIQVELSTERRPGGEAMAKVELWCDAPDKPIDRTVDADFWREPEGTAIELRLAQALAEFHGGRLLLESEQASAISLRLLLRTGTEHLTDYVVDRRTVAVDSDRGRRFEGRSGMEWAADLARHEEYRFLDVRLMAQAIQKERERSVLPDDEQDG